MSKLGAPSAFSEQLAELLSQKGLSLERLATLLEVAEAGGISAAAPGRPTQQSLMSRQLSELEQYFGLILTERNGRTLQLTPEGRLLAQHARWLFQGIADLRAQGKESTFSPIAIGAGDTALQFLVIPALARVSIPHRYVLRTLANDQVERQLIEGSIQVGVLRGSPRNETLNAHRIGRWEWALVVPSGLINPGESANSLLQRIPLALQSSEPQFLADVLDDLQVHPESLALRCDTFAQALQAVHTGKYASVLPRGLLGEERGVTSFSVMPYRSIDLFLAWSPQAALARPTLASAIEAFIGAFPIHDSTVM